MGSPLQSAILRLPDFGPGDKLVIDSGAITIDRSWTLYRTAMSYLFTGYDRTSVLAHLLQVDALVQQLLGTSLSLVSVYTINNYRAFNLLSAPDRETIQVVDSLLESAALDHLTRCIDTLLHTYAGDGRTMDRLRAYRANATELRRLLVTITAVFTRRRIP